MADQMKAAPGMLSEAKIIELWAAQRRYHGGEPCKLGHIEFALSVLAAAGNSQSLDALQALAMIHGIATGSTTANSLPHIAQIAGDALNGKNWLGDSLIVSIADLRAIDKAMDHMGDQLNEIDAVEDEDLEATQAGFAAISRLLGKQEGGAA